MKTLLALFGLALTLATTLPAQEPPPSPPLPSLIHTPEQLDQLLGPIALYPDALIALILPASTASSDIVLASRYLQGGNDPNAVENQPWDDSVRSLAHYPEVINWMDQNLIWTKQVGEAFVAQPAEVMQSVQRLRAAARAAGTLTDTMQQQVLYEGETISIVPSQPDVIYVPYYDPEIVYVAQPRFYDSGPFLSFGVGFPVGSWLSFNLDWGHRRVWYVSHDERERYWREHRDWRYPAFPGRPTYVRDPGRHLWSPPPNFVRSTQIDVRRPRVVEVVRPTPLPSAPSHTFVRRSDPTPGRIDVRDRPAQARAPQAPAPQATERTRDRGASFNRQPAPPPVVAAPAPAFVPHAPVVAPPPVAAPPAPPRGRADFQRGRNEGRPPETRQPDVRQPDVRQPEVRQPEVRQPVQPGRSHLSGAVPRGSLPPQPPPPVERVSPGVRGPSPTLPPPSVRATPPAPTAAPAVPITQSAPNQSQAPEERRRFGRDREPSRQP